MIYKSLESEISPKFKKYVPEFKKKGLENIIDFTRLKEKDPFNYNNLINEICEEKEVFSFKRELEQHMKKERNLLIGISLVLTVVLLLFIYISVQ